MSGDRSRERRQLAGERLIFAQQMTDWKIRASVLGMTQRWLDLAETREPDAFDKALRLRAISNEDRPRPSSAVFAARRTSAPAPHASDAA
jgi:hypothetical protein